MRERIFYLIKQRLFFILLFVVFKLLFLIYHGTGIQSKDALDVIWHGLAMDNTVAAYFCAIPTIFVFVSLFWNRPILYRIWKVYIFIAILFCTSLLVPDMELYTYWGFRIDSSVLMYLQYPKEAFASVPLWQPLTGMAIWLVLAWALSLTFGKWVLNKPFGKINRHKGWNTLLFFLLIPSLFISIRGSLSASTMNVGRAYYSENMFLNHAAVNPVFSFLSSVFDQEKVNSYAELSDQEFDREFAKIQDLSDCENLPVIKPNSNLVFIVLEGFSSSMISALDSLHPATPELDRVAKEGLIFTNIYSNSYRTDRGLTSIMSAMPALPTVSWMKYPAKLSKLPSWIKPFEQAGYDTELVYGGDIDFTNMRMYFNSLGFKKITSQDDFPKRMRQASWGVHDENAFNYLLENIEKQESPFVRMLLTLSSHEPYDVPYFKSEDKVLNAVQYTDSCIGVFIDRFRKMPQWENTLVVFTADHATRYPAEMSNHDLQRYRIPLLWTGGALLEKGKRDIIGSQTDIARTLLCQFGLKGADRFPLSKNLMSETGPEFGFYIYKNGYGVVSDSGAVAHDFDLNETVLRKGAATDSLMRRGKIILQYLEQELQSR
ncbi:MAG: LTA synthase family protein [Bacteroidales bacterium]